MAHLFEVCRRLFSAERKVKLCALILLGWAAPAWAQTPQPFAPFVVKQAMLWLPDYLDSTLKAYGLYNRADLSPDAYAHVPPSTRRRVELIYALYKVAVKFRANQLRGPDHILFRPETDPAFKLPPADRPYMAVTGKALDSDILFNITRIGDPRHFGFAAGLALGAHELGHKIKDQGFSQEEIDDVADLLRQRFARQMQIYNLHGTELAVLNLVPYREEGEVMIGPYPSFPSRIAPVIGVLNGNDWVDLSEALVNELDELSSPYASAIETRRSILQVMSRRVDERGLHLRLEIRTTRFPKNLDSYLVRDLQPNHFKTAEVLFSPATLAVEVEGYRDVMVPRPAVTDAEAELHDPAVTADGVLSARLHLHLRTEEFFHAASFPDSRFTLLALLDGEPIQLEANARYVNAPFGYGMPADVYKKPFVKEAMITVNLADQLPPPDPAGPVTPRELEIIGMVDQFFHLGHGFETSDEQRRRVPFGESMVVTLPADCGIDLAPTQSTRP